MQHKNTITFYLYKAVSMPQKYRGLAITPSYFYLTAFRAGHRPALFLIYELYSLYITKIHL
ncbi:hypothetical protein CMT77_03145 [Elizabethkingia anophelis]|nr:hypothetical protein [Elizabethkingia anophelis]